VRRACEVLMLDPRRLQPWSRGRDRAGLTEADLTDTPPMAKCRPHTLLPAEREEIVAAAKEDELAPPPPSQAHPPAVSSGPGVLLGVLGPGSFARRASCLSTSADPVR
jgi:hypothetical protein